MKEEKKSDIRFMAAVIAIAAACMVFAAMLFFVMRVVKGVFKAVFSIGKDLAGE